MRPVSRLFVLLTLLGACQLQTPHSDGPQVTATESITVTTLAPVAQPGVPQPQTTPAVAEVALQVPDSSTPRPAPRPQDLHLQTPGAASDTRAPDPTTPQQTTPQQTTPAAPLSPEQALCQKSGGEWSEMAGATGHVCAHRMRDSGKFCRKKGDCQGECLARSNTCAPISPMMGCNDILQANGTEVTLCLQ